MRERGREKCSKYCTQVAMAYTTLVCVAVVLVCVYYCEYLQQCNRWDCNEGVNICSIKYVIE